MYLLSVMFYKNINCIMSRQSLYFLVNLWYMNLLMFIYQCIQYFVTMFSVLQISESLKFDQIKFPYLKFYFLAYCISFYCFNGKHAKLAVHWQTIKMNNIDLHIDTTLQRTKLEGNKISNVKPVTFRLLNSKIGIIDLSKYAIVYCLQIVRFIINYYLAKPQYMHHFSRVIII